RCADEAAIPGLVGQGFAVPPALRGAPLGPAGADLDGAQRRGPATRCTLGRPDDFRGISALELNPGRTTFQTIAAADITSRVAGAIGEIAPEAWDACANPVGEPVLARGLSDDLRAKSQDCGGELLEAPAPVANGAYNPFISHAFLSAIERSGS